jgi:hypothetical protein
MLVNSPKDGRLDAGRMRRLNHADIPLIWRLSRAE